MGTNKTQSNRFIHRSLFAERGKEKDVGKTFKSENYELLDSLLIEKSRHDGVHLHTIGQGYE